MKIYIDNIIFKWQRSGGISVVWYELIKRILKEKQQEFQYYYIEYFGTDRNLFHKSLAIPASNILLSKANNLFKLKRYFSETIKKERDRFIFHSTYYRICTNNKAINIITVHDFTYEIYNTGITKWIHCITKHKSLRKADYIICISENTKKDLLQFVNGIDKKKVRVIYNGASDDFHYLAKEKNEQWEKVLEKSFLVFVGSRASYKNYNIAVKIAAKANMKLMIVGCKLNSKELKFTKEYLDTNFEELGYINNNELNKLYNKAFALIYPSSYEGFGLPVIEAQKAGCPVLALKKSSIIEIIGNQEQLISKLNVDLFCKQIDKLKDFNYREKIIQEGITNSKKYSWDKTYLKYKELYQEIANKYN